MTGNATPTPPSPVLALLERLARTATAGGLQAGAVRVESVEPLPDGAALQVRLGPPGTLLDAAVRVRLTITAVEADRTRCTLTLPQSPGLSRLLGGALNRLPGQFLRPALERLAGDAVTLDGDTLVLHHGPLVRRLRKRDA